ncbi:hypothetical protein [Paracraurococcus lichenis]|uniref:Uncharacterized protein n=1 Tax=Paracraurococcus lichenis TaxID=3064888 RepID=A0ABT9E9L3_9PROT|nr:hypothetical protein [Paracraurococcus sp. LOR1-02]MDO9712620.1 hypothetical protein [Paracraurococcus sp. LOR1-02]
MSNIAGKAYAMNVLTPMKPRWTWVQVALFMLSRSQPTQLLGLLGLKLIHFARWVIIRRDQWPDLGQPELKQSMRNDYMLFLSNFNGTWDQYIDAFADGIPSGLDLFWYASTKYPHSIPIADFKAYITHNQIDTSYYYNATPGAAQRDIKRALRIQSAIADLTKVAEGNDAAAFAAAYRRAMIEGDLQNALGSHGYAPSASVATERADARKADFLRKSKDPAWAAPFPGAPSTQSAPPDQAAAG